MSSMFKSKAAAATLILLLVLPTLGVLFPAVNTPLAAASPGAAITLVPSKGAVGTLVKIYGSGFTAGKTVTVYFDANGNGIYESGEIWASTTVKSDGTFNFTLDTTDNRKAVPSVTAGYRDYRVYASDGVVSDTVYFTVAEPTIVISPDKGTAGTEISVSINYFTTTADVQVFFDANKNEVPDDNDVIIQVKAADLNNTGGASDLKITVPEWIGYGTYNVIAKNALGDVASKTFTIMEPVLVISPTQGIASTKISIWVNYYNRTDGAQPTYVYFDTNKNERYDVDEPKVELPLPLNNTGGNDVAVTLIVPAVPEGTYMVYANNSLGQVSYAAFEVPAPVIVITKYPRGVPDTPVEVEINYFDPTKQVDIGYNIDRNRVLEKGEVVVTITTEELNKTGGWSGVVEAPSALGYGPYTINATNSAYDGMQSATTTFEVMHPQVTIEPKKGTAGTPVTINVYWFNKTAGDVIVWIDINKNRLYDVLAETVATISVDELDDTGNRTDVSGTIPSGIGFGIWTVNASNNVQYTTDTFTVMEPIMSISPDKGTAGTDITVNLSYYNITDDAQPTYVYFDLNKNRRYDEGVDTIVDVTPELNEMGNATVELTVPSNVWYGPYTVYANNTLGQVRSATFTVMEPVMTISPTFGGPGTTVTVIVNYYNKTMRVIVFFDVDSNGVFSEAEPHSEISPTNLNNTGGASTTIQVPFGINPGVYRIYAYNDYQSRYCEFSVVTPEQAIEEKLDNIVIPRLDEIKAMLGNEDYGLSALKSAIGTLSSRIEEIAGTIMDKLSAIGVKVDAIKDVVDAIKLKTDALPAWGDLVTKNFADLTGYIDSAKSAILTAIQSNSTAIKTAIDNVQSEVTNSTYGLAAIKDAISGLETKLNLLSTQLETFMESASEDIISIRNAVKNETYGLAAIMNAVSNIEVKLDEALPGIGEALSGIRTDLSEIKASIAPPIVIEGTKTCPNMGSVELFSVNKTMRNGAPFKVSFTIDATQLDPGDSVYMEVYVKAKADSSLVMAQQILIYGRAGADRREVYMESLVNAEQVVVKLTYYLGNTSDDPIHFQAVIGSP